ncbi:MAG: SEC-C domain-containing protein [Betaproteobacteria bacterium]|nr:SEC-C domain-containing protein [Betaproteobacteria bacterium]
MKLGRNDPCSCGSGRKYKHCCGGVQAEPPEDPRWIRLNRATHGLVDELLKCAKRHFGPEGVHEAWQEFNLWPEEEEPFDPASPHLMVFLPWFLHHWIPDERETAVAAEAQKTTVAQAYLAAKGTRLDPLARRYLEACGEAAFSFHEVLRCEPGQGVRIRDVLSAREIDVIEHLGSRQFSVGDILFAHPVTVDGITVFDGMSPVPIPPQHKVELIELRRRYVTPRGGAFGAEELREIDIELLAAYHGIVGEILDPRMPQIQNTDGEPLLLHTIEYAIDSPEEAFEALKDLAAGLPAEEAGENAEYDASGRLARVDLAWRRPGNAMHKHWENTILGHIHIDGGKLTANVNSKKRATELRRLIKERLGRHARHVGTQLQSPEDLIEEARAARARSKADKDKSPAEGGETDHDRLMRDPAVAAQIAEHVRAHYVSWVDQKIPALGNRTPREAVGDADGREAVEALLLQMERDGAKMRPPLDPAILRELRATLGLARGA